MYLHLGNNIVVNVHDIIGIFDIEKTTIGKYTRQFLSQTQKNNEIINVSQELPRSFIVCETKNKTYVYISPISSSTLLKRMTAVNKSIYCNK